MRSTRFLRVLTIFGQGICLPYRFCMVHIPPKDKIVWMLYGLRNTSPISRTGLYGARNGPIRLIGPNLLAGPVTDAFGIRKTIQVSSIGKTGTKTMSESCTCPTFSPELQSVFRKLVHDGTTCRPITIGLSGFWPSLYTRFWSLRGK